MTMTKTSIWPVILLASCPLLAIAQQDSLRSNPSLPADVLGPQLIMWTQMQKPQPLPQPLPPPERADQPQASPHSDSAPTQAEPATQFTGTIVKDGSRYALKVSDSTTYQVDDQERAKTFEGKQVKVSGTLDPRLNILRITSIELLS